MSKRLTSRNLAALLKGKPCPFLITPGLRRRSSKKPKEHDTDFLHAFFGFPKPVKEHRFHPERRWRFDLAWPEKKVALEIEGGVWTGGRHTRPSGFLGDMEKYNSAALLGWRVFRVTPAKLRAMDTIQMLKEALQ
jgi:hypothetical protein